MRAYHTKKDLYTFDLFNPPKKIISSTSSVMDKLTIFYTFQMILKRKQISFHRSVRCGPIEKFVTKIYTLLYHIPYLMPRLQSL